MAHDSESAVSLMSVKAGARARVQAVDGGHQLGRRLASMGIYPGAEIKVVRGGGPVIVEVRGTRVVVGRGMASRVMVNPVT